MLVPDVQKRPLPPFRGADSRRRGRVLRRPGRQRKCGRRQGRRVAPVHRHSAGQPAQAQPQHRLDAVQLRPRPHPRAGGAHPARVRLSPGLAGRRGADGAPTGRGALGKVGCTMTFNSIFRALMATGVAWREPQGFRWVLRVKR